MRCVKRRSAFALLFLLLSLACGRQERPAPHAEAVVDDTTPQDGGTVIRRLESDIATLNPVLATSEYDRYVDNYLFTPLVYFDQNLKCIPGLADSWDISADGREYTFHLNPKATFSDGTPVLASDVIFTLKKIVDPQSEAAQIATGFEQADLTKSRAVDPHTVVVAFKEVLASQLIRFNDLQVIPEHVYSTGDFRNDYNSRAVGSGPYRLVRRVAGTEILVQRRPDYWGTMPHLDKVLFKVVLDNATAWNALKHGDVDETYITSDTWAIESRRPEQQRAVDFRRFYGLNYNYVAWNERRPIFADKRVRRALGMCVDLSSIINNIYRGTARAMNGPFTPDQWAYNPAVPVLPFDPTGAKRLLNDAGWFDRNGSGVLQKDGQPFKFDFYIFAGSNTGTMFATLLQEELKKIGVTMNVVTLEPTLMFDRISSGNYDAAYLSWSLTPDPDPYQTMHSSQIPPKGQNFVFYSSPEADKLIEAGRRELDQSKRQKIYQRLHEVLAEDQPYTWTVQVSAKWAINKRLHNVKEGRGLGLFLWYPGEFDWWIPRDQRIHDVPPARPVTATGGR